MECIWKRGGRHNGIFYVGLKPFRPIRTSAGLWDVGTGARGDIGSGRNGRRPESA